MSRRQSRLTFGEYFRDSLNVGAPSLIPPHATADAVRAMTCHAAKGLEFPYVAVVGQTLSAAPRGYKWLPPNLQPSAERRRPPIRLPVLRRRHEGAARAHRILREHRGRKRSLSGP